MASIHERSSVMLDAPAEWKVRRLGTFATKVGSGATPRGGKSVYLTSRESHALIRSQHVFDRRFDDDKIAFISEEHSQKLRNAEVRPGDILLNITGDGVTFARACIVPDDILPACVNQHVSIVRVDHNVCAPGYLLAYLTHPITKHYIESFNTGGSRRAITKGHIESFEVPLPPLPVQQRIADILSAYDELMENSQRRIRLLEEMARALYREWFVHFRFPGHEKLPLFASPLGDIPQGWEVAPLSSFVDFAKGRKPAETRQEPLPGDVKLLLIDSLHGGEAVFTSPAKLVLAETRDTIMVMDGASSCEVTIGSSGAVGSTLGRFRTTRPDVFSPHALYRFLEAKAEEFKSKNIGAAIPHANRDYILTQAVALPPKAVASIFHARLEPTQGTIETLKTQIHNLRRTRDLLLPHLLSPRK